MPHSPTLFGEAIDELIKCAEREAKKSNTVNRIEVITEDGRAYTNYDVASCEVAYQDNSKTMKIFIKTK
ncbi:MAG: hypothetical protein ACRCZY_00445, partial [Phocaeicola sp.]